ncbi:MAG: PD40 domain-containing protein [Acidobacteria bacterium]|nr:PD40 domain-containing protein [Acidobacteriota bacterium]
MDPDRWGKVEALYEAAVGLEPDRRSAFLAEQCAGDEALRQEVESLLCHGENAGDFLRAPAPVKPLETGQRVRHYEIQEKLGEGGMGAVYRAYDSQLRRPVALKVLPPEFAADPERRQRLLREARAASALTHPNIVGVYEVGSDNGVDFIAMEFVEGKTLEEMVTAKGLALAKALDYGAQIAAGLARAHSVGVIHRDLKPGNIMVTREGLVKLLDFGLARRVRLEPGEASTLTVEGEIAGTPAYMSPEQAEGKPLDERSDVFSFGLVLYRMLAGRPAFSGNSAAAVMAAVLREEPAPLGDKVPREVERIVRRCLRKEPARRFQHVDDIKVELEELAAASQPAPRRGARRWLWPGVALAAIAIAGTAWWLARRVIGAGRSAPLRTEFLQITSQPGAELFPSISPDGKWLVYGGESAKGRHIFLQAIGGQTPLDLTPDSTGDEDQPVFSPDGEHIAFHSTRAGGGIFVMGRTGEAVRRVTNRGFNPAWSPDGTHLAFAAESVELYAQWIGQSELWMVAVNTGETHRLAPAVDAVLPNWSPHNLRIAYTTRAGTDAKGDVGTIPVGGGTPVPVASDPARDWNPVWSPDGKYLYFSSDRGGSMNLWRVPIDETSGKTLGPAESVSTPAAYLAHPSISADGRRILYTSALITANIQRLTLDASGNPQGEPFWVTTGTRRWSSPDPSPDGDWVAFYSLTQPEGQLYISRTDGTGLRQLTGDAADRMPHWSPDGGWIAFFSSRGGDRGGNLNLWKIHPDGSGLSQLTEVGTAYLMWSPDGSRIAATTSPGNKRVLVFDPNRAWKEQTAETLPPPEPAQARYIVNSWSADGRYLVGQQTDALPGIVRYSFATRGYDHLADFGEWPVWLPDSRRVLFVANGNGFFIVDSGSHQVRRVYSVRRDVLGPPRLTRDGRTAFYSRRVTEADIWLCRLK